MEAEQIRKIKRYDSLLHTHQRSLVKIVRLQDEIDSMIGEANSLRGANKALQDRVNYLEGLIQKRFSQ